MESQLTYMSGTINYKVEGSGSNLVLLHGFTESLGIWDHFTTFLSKSYKIIRIDLPGHGHTSIFKKPHSMDFMADIVHAVLHSLDINRCSLVGHSMGGYVSLAFARKYPGMLDSICLFHSHAASDSAEAKENRQKTIKVVMENKEAFIRSFIPDLFASHNRIKYKNEIESLKTEALKMSSEGIIKALEGMKARKNSIPFLKLLEIPVLFIAGDQDPRIPVSMIEEQASSCKNPVIEILHGTGHMGFIEARDKSVSLIRDFAAQELT